jgi:ketosteroid isomerase-like protein
MGARGPHDDFETAKETIHAAYAEFNLTQDRDALRRKYLSDELEYVTRQGTFQGTDQFLSELEVQQQKWTLESEVEEVIDAGEGAIIGRIKFMRVDRETGEVAWKAWPAVVLRVHNGKLVFFEGYIDPRRALADFGVEQG